MAYTQPPATARFDTIDMLRGLAILAVILLHLWLRFSFGGFHLEHGMPRWLGHLLFRNGGNGVTVFFAISGFLITYTSLARFGSLAAIEARRFYRIRFARIAPLLLLLLLVLSVLHLLHLQDFFIHKAHASLAGAVLSTLSFTLNWYEAGYLHGWLPACWTVLWSLSIEEMFYLFFPLSCLLLLRLRRGMPAFVLSLFGLMIAGCFARTVWSHGDDLAQENSYLAGMGNIAVGVLAALLTRRLQGRKPLPAGVLLLLQTAGTALIVLFALYPRWSWIQPFMRFTGNSGTDDLLLACGTGLVMIGSVLRSFEKNRAGQLWTAPLRWFGRHSYELYLTHEFIVLAAVNHYLKLQVTRYPGPLGLYVGSTVLLCALLGWIAARFFSEPMNRLLRGARPPAAGGHGAPTIRVDDAEAQHTVSAD